MLILLIGLLLTQHSVECDVQHLADEYSCTKYKEQLRLKLYLCQRVYFQYVYLCNA